MSTPSVPASAVGDDSTDQAKLDEVEADLIEAKKTMLAFEVPLVCGWMVFKQVHDTHEFLLISMLLYRPIINKNSIININQSRSFTLSDLKNFTILDVLSHTGVSIEKTGNEFRFFQSC